MQSHARVNDLFLGPFSGRNWPLQGEVHKSKGLHREPVPTLAQHCPTELSLMAEMFYICATR